MEVVLAVAIIGGLIATFALAANKKKSGAWEAAASALGLSFGPGPHSNRKIVQQHHLPEMFGPVSGRDVYVGVRSFTTGSGKNRRTNYRTYVDVIFEVPLKRGLKVSRSDGVSIFFGSIFGQRDIQIGDAAFDKEFHVDGLDQAQVSALLSADVRSTLRRPVGDFQGLLSDEQVRFEAGGVIVEASALRPVIDAAVALDRQTQAAWQELPPTALESALAVGWRALADRRQLTLRPREMIAKGTIDDVVVHCEVALEKAGFVTVIRAVFNPPLAVGLAVSKQGGLARIGKFFGGQDIEVGDPIFDSSYVIKGSDVGRIKEIFASNARDGLRSLSKLSEQLVVSDDMVEITLDSPRTDAAEVEQLVDLVASTANAMVKFRKPQAIGPYR